MKEQKKQDADEVFNISKQFVPYEECLKLKELGFNEKCFGYYRIANDGFNNPTPTLKNTLYQVPINSWSISAPLWQQAFDFFRIKYGFNNINIYSKENTNEWYFTIYNNTITTNNEILSSYEEARLDCLRELIKLAKEKK